MVIAAIWIILGTILVIGGAKAKTGTLKKNSWIGIRSREVNRSAETWRVGQMAAAHHFLVCGAICIFLGVACLFVGEMTGAFIGMLAALIVVFGTLRGTRKAEDAVDAMGPL